MTVTLLHLEQNRSAARSRWLVMF